MRCCATLAVYREVEPQYLKHATACAEDLLKREACLDLIGVT